MPDNEEVFSTPWFQIVAKNFNGSSKPYYVVESTDCVSILAITENNEVLLVKQYRPTLDCETLELPSGHIEESEDAEEAACRELLEETGYESEKLEFLGILATDTGRLGNKLWCYFAPKVKKANIIVRRDATEKIELVKCSPEELVQYIRNGKIFQTQDIASCFLSIQKKKLVFNNGHPKKD